MKTIVALSLLAGIGPGNALEPSDTMGAWKRASAEDKRKLIEKILHGRGAASAGVIECVDSASAVPSHADLPIAEVVRACQGGADQPV